MGASVDETFTIQNSMAKWESTDETGKANISSSPMAYVNINGTTESLAVLIRQVLAQPAHTLPLLPSGTASVKQLLTTTVKANGKQKKIKLMALSGLGFTPSYL
jgi:hypothetical protein